MKAWLSPWPFFCFVGVVLARRPGAAVEHRGFGAGRLRCRLSKQGVGGPEGRGRAVSPLRVSGALYSSETSSSRAGWPSQWAKLAQDLRASPRVPKCRVLGAEAGLARFETTLVASADVFTAGTGQPQLATAQHFAFGKAACGKRGTVHRR